MLLVIKLLLHIPGLSHLYFAYQTGVLRRLAAEPTGAQRQQRCVWCWDEKHPHKRYPHRTSSMCAMHSRRQRAALATSRAARAAGKEAAA